MTNDVYYTSKEDESNTNKTYKAHNTLYLYQLTLIVENQEKGGKNCCPQNSSCSKVQWFEYGEKNSKYFYNLERKKKSQKEPYNESTAPVSQRSWVRIRFKPEFFSGLIFATA